MHNVQVFQCIPFFYLFTHTYKKSSLTIPPSTFFSTSSRLHHTHSTTIPFLLLLQEHTFGTSSSCTHAILMMHINQEDGFKRNFHP
ncbi:hypothetical protein L6452_29329 [Arctium lappa]|uniref:Uncharacterized protein n=1 Tax=Arctium lappa TaxID=4217 RepID=A0ACB8ZFK5_ARCLA|nr:hypothetical protein L6452_29329 [Arctium lappa]